MFVTTLSGNHYTYERKSNMIVEGIHIEKITAAKIIRPKFFHEMLHVNTFVVCVTTMCNLRCSYCCYSGKYRHNRTHGNQSFSIQDFDELIVFVSILSPNNYIHIIFYGGECLLDFNNIASFVDKAIKTWPKRVRFSISTNGTLLQPSIIDWCVKYRVVLNISIDGLQRTHDLYRKTKDNQGSFMKIYRILIDIRSRYPSFFKENVNLLLTITDISLLTQIALEWQRDDLLSYKAPAHISLVEPNFQQGIEKTDEQEIWNIYDEMLQTYSQHTENVVFKSFFQQEISRWEKRNICQLEEECPIPICIPWNQKLYIDIDGGIGLCEKTCDNLRIGNIKTGIDWQKANQVAQDLYDLRLQRCSMCPIIRVCDICPVELDLEREEMDIYCHNKIVNFKLKLWLLCEMAERGLL